MEMRQKDQWGGSNFDPDKYETMTITGSNSPTKYGHPYSTVHNIYPDVSHDDSLGDAIMWETHHVTLTKVVHYGFGIAVSGGRDNPHFSSGEPSIAISDVLKEGPADGRLFINDRVLFVNSVSLENVDYNTAISVLKECGDTVHLIVRRKASPQSQCREATLLRTLENSHLPWGVVFGCKLFVSRILPDSIASKEKNIHEGDVILSINGQKASHLSLVEAQKLVDRCRDRHLKMNVSKHEREILNRTGVSDNSADLNQNYNSSPRLNEEKMYSTNTAKSSADDGPPRPPLPACLDSNYQQVPIKKTVTGSSGQQVPLDSRVRIVQFTKYKSGLGIRVSGGNRTGVFVATVNYGTPAYGLLFEGDVLLSVNGMELGGRTREEVVTVLMNLREQVELQVQSRKEDFSRLMQDGGSGDSFYVRAHFSYDTPDKDCMPFKNSDVFHVTDTLYNGVPGFWCVRKLGKGNKTVEIGVIPNLEKAREYVAKQKEIAQSTEDKENKRSSSIFFMKRARRSKSLSKDHWEEVVFSNPTTKFDAYERVVLRDPPFVRPVVIFGSLADVARDHLLKNYAKSYESPQAESNTKGRSGIIKLQSIRKVIETQKHCLLDVTPSAVDRLQHAQYVPIVVFLKAASKATVKYLRNKSVKKSRKSPKSLFDQSEKLEKIYSHLFTTYVHLEGEKWLYKLEETINSQQQQPVWMTHEAPEMDVDDEYFFPMAGADNRHSYASGPEDLGEIDAVWNQEHEHVPQSQHRISGRKHFYRTNSDPSLSTTERVPGIPPYPNPPAYMHGYDPPTVPPLPQKNGPSKSHTDIAHYPHDNELSRRGEPLYSRVHAKQYQVVEQATHKTHQDPKTYSSTPSLREYRNQAVMDEYLANQQDDVKLRVKEASSRREPTYTRVPVRQPLSPATSGYTSDDQKLSRRETRDSSPQSKPPPNRMNYERNRPRSTVVNQAFPKYPGHDRPVSHYVDRQNFDWLQKQKQQKTWVSEADKLAKEESPYGKLSDFQSEVSPPRRNVPTHLDNPIYVDANHIRRAKHSARPGKNNPYSSTSSFQKNDRIIGRLNSNKTNGEKLAAIKSSQNHFSDYSQFTNQRSYHQDSQQRPTPPPPPPPPKPPISSASSFQSYKKIVTSPGFYATSSSNGVPQVQRDRLQSEEGEHEVVATASGVFGYDGGILDSPESGVSIVIPKGAIPHGVQQNIYFKVCKDNSLMPPLDKEKGETLLSPLVMCGPHGLKFDQPVELRLPHCASVNPDSWAFALKSSSDTTAGDGSKWQDVQLAGLDALSQGVVGKNSVSVLVDHF